MKDFDARQELYVQLIKVCTESGNNAEAVILSTLYNANKHHITDKLEHLCVGFMLNHLPQLLITGDKNEKTITNA